jgi:hypothetical protein
MEEMNLRCDGGGDADPDDERGFVTDHSTN